MLRDVGITGALQREIYMHVSSYNLDKIQSLKWRGMKTVNQDRRKQKNITVAFRLKTPNMASKARRFNDNILHTLAGRYNIKLESLCAIPGFMNILYQCQSGNTPYILRISHSTRRNEQLIRAECDWITYLYENGLPVAYPVLSENNQLVESLIDNKGDYFLATLFTKAHGKHPTKTDFNISFYKKYGQLLGKMHALTKNYIPSNKLSTRPPWNNKMMLDVARNIPQSEEIVFERFTHLYKYLNNLPKDNNSFGLIHQDPHTGNLFIDNKGRITIFDFDDCTYSWFINDISLVLFYAAMWVLDKPETFIADFLKHFYDGYSQENEISTNWFKEIQYFLKLRELDIYSLIYKNYDGKIASSQWAMNFMKERKFRIENNVPYLDLNFEAIIQ
jgi:Ser/Thr protein kinase RdoA (MazF antagonist)